MAEFPVLVSPRTTRGGFKNRLVVKDSFEAILGDGAYVGKYLIPEVELNSCQKKLDFACLLAIGTTPISIESKKLDGLDKSITLRQVRPIGTASYTISPGSVSRGATEWITDTVPDPILRNELSVFFNGLVNSNTLETDDTLKIFFNGKVIDVVIEEDGSLLSVNFESSLISNVAESDTALSVTFDFKLISTTNET